MRVGMYYRNSDLRLEHLPVPEVGPGALLVKVLASGICGSDLLEWYRTKRAPLVLGHEVAGEVVEVGGEVRTFRKGDRVFATHHVPCGECHYCLNGHLTACDTFQTANNFSPGGFAEFVRVSGRSVHAGTLRLPDRLSCEEGSFIEPLGTAVRGLRTADLRPGACLLVIGAGIAGLLMIKLAAALGAGRIVAADVCDFRLRAALACGAEHVVPATEDVPGFVRQVNGGRLADRVVLCAGALPAAQQAVRSVDRGGMLVFFAVPRPGEELAIDFNPFWRNDVSIRTCYGAAPLDNAQALELLRSGRITVSDLVTHRFGLSRIQEAFLVASRPESCLKVIVEPQEV